MKTARDKIKQDTLKTCGHVQVYQTIGGYYYIKSLDYIKRISKAQYNLYIYK